MVETVLQLKPLAKSEEVMVVDGVKSEGSGTPVGLPERPSNPANMGVLVVPGSPTVTVIVPGVCSPGVPGVNERNWSKPGVVVDVTYSAGMV